MRAAVRWSKFPSALLMLFGLAAGCGDAEAPHCGDILPAADARFGAVADLVVRPGPKGCSPCHNTETPIHGFNFEGRGVAYDALTARSSLVYDEIASGRMPKHGSMLNGGLWQAVAWDERDLQLLRSWYCHGAFYEE